MARMAIGCIGLIASCLYCMTSHACRMEIMKARLAKGKPVLRIEMDPARPLIPVLY